jgi:hypothetical protein
MTCMRSHCNGDNQFGEPAANPSNCGSVLTSVLGFLIVTGVAVTVVLIFVNSRRESARRVSDQEGQEISLEERIVAVKQRIENDLIQSGKSDLGSDGVQLDANGHKLTLNLPDPNPTVSVLFDVGAQRTTLRRDDPLMDAQAITNDLSVDGSSQPAASSSPRLPLKGVSITPAIEVRQLPASEFTVFALSAVNIDSRVFDTGIGRTYTGGTLTLVNGNVTATFPVLAANGFSLPDSTLTFVPVDDPSGVTPATLTQESFDSDTFYGNARTSLNSGFLTGNVLPLNIRPADQIYATDSNGNPILDSNGSRVLDMGKFYVACSTRVIAAPGTDGTYHVTVNGGPVNSFTIATDTAQNIILVFDYQQFQANQNDSVYLEVRNASGSPAQNGVVKIRHAQQLSGNLSIVSPNIIQIAGDFNVTAPTVAASLITSDHVESVDDD